MAKKEKLNHRQQIILLAMMMYALSQESSFTRKWTNELNKKWDTMYYSSKNNIPNNIQKKFDIVWYFLKMQIFVTSLMFSDLNW